MAPEATIRPRAMMTTSSHTSSTRSSWWLLKTTPAPAAACSRTTSVIVAMPMGSSPENGSSRAGGPRAEAGGRLVHAEPLRVGEERRGELDCLLVAVRLVLELGSGTVAEAHPLEPRGRYTVLLLLLYYTPRSSLLCLSIT